MAQWYVKELSKLTQISVQTLHHYDRIGLLEPSVRLANGYRLYSEKDLSKLQQIIALKFFGFELSQIKTLLSTDVDMIDHFSVQSQLLEEKAKTLFDASQSLKKIISNCRRDKSIPWETIIKLIEVYRMTQQLENKWIGEILSADELKEYANFEQELQTRYSVSEKKASEEEWNILVSDINSNLNNDPASQIGIDIGRRCMIWTNNLYGKKHAALRKSIWEKGFKSGHGSDKHGLSSASIEWLDKAIYAYHTDRIKFILKQIENNPVTLWENLLVDICGEDQELRDQLINDILQNENINSAAKNWIKKISTNK